MITFPNAKINLGLSVTGRRSDGFHELETGMYPIPLFDILEIVPSEQKTAVKTSGIAIPGDPNSNLVYRAWEILREQFSIPDTGIHLYKNIPLGAGLGGGSSDAAFALKMMNTHFNLDIPSTRLMLLAAKLGSDCPFFIKNIPVLAGGKGEQLNPLSVDLTGVALLLVFPGIHINTKEAYSWIRPNKKNHPLRTYLLKDRADWKKNLINDFEPVVFDRYPVLHEMKQKIYRSGAFYASMSGSGSTLFGLFDKKDKLPDKELFPDCRIWTGIL